MHFLTEAIMDARMSSWSLTYDLRWRTVLATLSLPLLWMWLNLASKTLNCIGAMLNFSPILMFLYLSSFVRPMTGLHDHTLVVCNVISFPFVDSSLSYELV